MKRTKLSKPVMIVYDWPYSEPSWCERKTYVAETYGDYQRVMRIINENKDEYRLVSVTTCKATTRRRNGHKP